MDLMGLINKMNLKHKYRAWAEISAGALVHNLNYAKEKTGRKVMCVIKGNAHGHGAVECGKIFEKAGADAFAVAAFPEAIELREAGIKIPVLVLGWTDPDSVKDMIKNDISQSALSLEYAKELSAEAVKTGGNLKVHAKLDTGMTRTGIFAQHDASAAADDVIAVNSLPGLDMRGIFTHFAAADMPEKDDYTAWQLENYKNVLKELKKKGFDKQVVHHVGNSATIMYHPEAYFDMVREGVMMYGFYPNGIYEENGPLEAVLSLKARVAQVKEIPAGTSVSYGCTFTSDHPMKIAAVTAGYADSYPRIISNRGAWSVIRGHKCRQIGRICMDICMFDVSDVPDVTEGDEVILYGRGGMPLDKIAELTGSINCEPTCLLTQRVEKIYVE